MKAPKCRTCGHNHYGTCLQCPECKEMRTLTPELAAKYLTGKGKQNDIKKDTLLKEMPILRGLKISVCTQKQPKAGSVCTQVDKPVDVYAHCQTCKYKLYYEKHKARNREAMRKRRNA